MKPIYKQRKGFTLIELLVVMTMLSLVAGAMIYNFRKGEKQKRINLSKDTVVLALRTAQNYALTGKQIPPPNFAPHVRGAARCVGNNAAVSYWAEFAVNPGGSPAPIYVMGEDTCGAVMRVETYQVVPNTTFSDPPFTNIINFVASNTNNIAVRFTLPFGNISSSTNLTPTPANFANFSSANIDINYVEDAAASRRITVDGISGRIE